MTHSPALPRASGLAALPALAILALALVATSAQAETVVQKKLNLPADLLMSVTGGCDHRGSTVTLGPELILQDLPAKVVFDGGGTHDASALQTVDILIDLHGSIQLPKQPVLGGVTGNPKISVYIADSLVVGPVRCNKL